jgi:hypothetical protein
MNCRPGDLAIVVGGTHSSDVVGRIVRCVRWQPWRGVDAWIVEPRLREDRVEGHETIVGDWVRDVCLRPIRDNDGEDEMLRIAGKPREVETQ